MAIKMLEDYRKADSVGKEKIQLRFRKHAGSVDPQYKSAQLETDHEAILLALKSLVSCRVIPPS